MSFKFTNTLVAVGTVILFLIVVSTVAWRQKMAEPPPPSRDQLEQAAREEVARNQEAGRRDKEEAAKTDSAKPQANPFETDLGRTLMLRLFIKPALKEMLNDPESLQDLGLRSVKRLKGMPTTFRVSVFYRARNAFGALVGAEQAFAVIENQDAARDALDAWIVVPVKR